MDYGWVELVGFDFVVCGDYYVVCEYVVIDLWIQ